MKKGHNSLKKSSIFTLLRTLIILIVALRLSFVTFAVNSEISLNKFLVKKSITIQNYRQDLSRNASSIQPPSSSLLIGFVPRN